MTLHEWAGSQTTEADVPYIPPAMSRVEIVVNTIRVCKEGVRDLLKNQAGETPAEGLTNAVLKASNHAYNIASAEYVIKTPEGQYVQAECDAKCAAAMRAVLSALPPPATPGEEQP